MRTRMIRVPCSFATSALTHVGVPRRRRHGRCDRPMRVTSVGSLASGAAAPGAGVRCPRGAGQRAPPPRAWSAPPIFAAGAGVHPTRFGRRRTRLAYARFSWMLILGAVRLLFVGALTYLMPVVIGAGSSACALGAARFEAAALSGRRFHRGPDPSRSPSRPWRRNLSAVNASLSPRGWSCWPPTSPTSSFHGPRAQARAKRRRFIPTTTAGGRRG